MGNMNSWFKHYNKASQGHTLSVLWANGDTEAIALFWLLLELVSRFESVTSRGEITISWNTIGRETGWKPSKCRRVLSRIVPISKIEINEKQDGYISFLVPNWLELQENRGGKRDAKSDQKPDRSKKREERNKNKEIERERFDKIFALYPIRLEGEKAFERFLDQMKTEQDFLDLEKSIPNYIAYLSKPENAWRAPKQSFETYLGTKTSGFFWRQWIDSDAGTSTLPTRQKAQSEANSAINWTIEAEIIMQACKRYGFSSEAILPYVGIERVTLLRAAGGASKLGAEPDTPFTIKNLANKLKAAFEISQQAVS